MAGEKLAKAIKRAKPKESDFSDLVFGVVTSTSPLKIKVDENGLELDRRFFILSRMVQPLTVSITIDGKTGTGTVFRALQTGDKVIMLKVQKSQRYYVLERA